MTVSERYSVASVDSPACRDFEHLRLHLLCKYHRPAMSTETRVNAPAIRPIIALASTGPMATTPNLLAILVEWFIMEAGDISCELRSWKDESYQAMGEISLGADAHILYDSRASNSLKMMIQTPDCFSPRGSAGECPWHF